MNFQDIVYYSQNSSYPRVDMHFFELGQKEKSILIFLILFLIIGISVIWKHISRKRAQKNSITALHTWTCDRRRLDHWIREHGDCFEGQEAQWLVQKELGSLTFYTVIANVYNRYHKSRIEWLISKMDSEYVAKPPMERNNTGT